MNWIVFTDLDGTLLDARDYSFSEAQPGLNLLKTRKIPLIPCTSKTFAEVKEIRRNIHSDAPFIIENGSAVVFPKNYFRAAGMKLDTIRNFEAVVLGRPYAEIKNFLEEIVSRFNLKIRSFSQMDLSEIALHSGLDEEQASLAADRMFSEPFIAEEKIDNLDEIAFFARENNLRLLIGNRFYHLLGRTDKGRAVQSLLSLYKQNFGGTYKSIGLGDGPNDIELLLNVDYPVLVKRPPELSKKMPEISGMYYTKGTGPAGWSEAVRHLLK